ncbi:ABC transporter ATP-binding protein [Bacillus cereus group sp. BfR-BA-01492]|uniref:ATP-binding cassette domain-containing protein n=1 Tax=Bacillus cereus group sp. BfR-BA-01492 TaxID=2920361 RepID=UPI001F5A2C9E|nr:ABC transporter ATP-binding protein [Bacillus cereus group sp. BfR-BA-01492]
MNFYKEILRQSVSQHKKTILLTIGTSLIYSGSVLILLWLIINKRIKIGDFVATIDAIQRSQSVITNISFLLADLYQQRLYIRDLYSLFEYPEDKANNPVPFPKLEKSIEFNNLSFSYPFMKNYSLQNINLKIYPGEKVVIVGENGCGKTTLIKCLAGLFELNNGSILFDRTNINDIDKQSLQRNISITFQDFIKYELNVLENVTLKTTEKINRHKVEQILKQSGSYEFVQKLKDNYNTRLGRMFEDSIDLSGGQWQRKIQGKSVP